jgi:hypothetical protein
MELVRQLLFACAKFQFSIFTVHIAGVDNCIADALSRDDMTRFRNLCPQARDDPTAPVLPPGRTW